MKWISWVQPTNDYRPLNYPPGKNILGWWCTGYSENDDAILVALVDAKDNTEAWSYLKKDWPEYHKRFIEEKDDTKLSNRFPLQDWMKDRIDKYNKSYDITKSDKG